ncbi:MAG: MAPEG family protein [Pseudomonadota bacterium]|nr:MAPEG family protein [Pseudomonadota bacterium]
MTIPFWCLVFAMLMLVVTKVPVAVAQGRQGTGYDNQNPRDQQAGLTGWGRRALAAHQNAFESFAPFAAGVLVAHVGGASGSAAAALAVAHVLSRILYTILYIADLDKLRSLIWAVGFFSSVGLVLLPAFS